MYTCVCVCFCFHLITEVLAKLEGQDWAGSYYYTPLTVLKEIVSEQLEQLYGYVQVPLIAINFIEIIPTATYTVTLLLLLLLAHFDANKRL